MNLQPPAGSSSSQRPHQQGSASGTKAGKPVRVQVEWLVDTGADIGVVHKAVGDRFDLVATAASASPTTGGGGMIIKGGLEAGFEAEDRHGVSHAMRSTQLVGVKSNNSGSNIIGMDQLASVNASVEWDPTAQTGTLRIASPTSSSTSPPPVGGTGATLRRHGPPPAIVDHDDWLDVGGVRVPKNLWHKP